MHVNIQKLWDIFYSLIWRAGGGWGGGGGGGWGEKTPCTIIARWEELQASAPEGLSYLATGLCIQSAQTDQILHVESKSSFCKLNFTTEVWNRSFITYFLLQISFTKSIKLSLCTPQLFMFMKINIGGSF